MSHDEAAGLLALYALGALDDSDELLRHVSTCQVCQDELADFAETTTTFAEALPRVAPPARLFERITSSVQQGISMGSRQPGYVRFRSLPVEKRKSQILSLLSFWPVRGPALVAAALVFVLGVGIGAGILVERFGLSSPPSELSLDRQALSLLTSTETVNVRLEPVQPLGGDAHGHWFYRGGIMSTVMVIESMPLPSDGTAYWGWLQRKDGTWVDAGKFSTDRTGYGRLVITGLDGDDVLLVEVTEQAQKTTKPGGAVVLKTP